VKRVRGYLRQHAADLIPLLEDRVNEALAE
jgi:hypothetical protein